MLLRVEAVSVGMRELVMRFWALFGKPILHIADLDVEGLAPVFSSLPPTQMRLGWRDCIPDKRPLYSCGVR